MSDKERLIGWLVTYANDEQGEAHELRSGRTLISSQNGAKNTSFIALSSKTVSSPHSAIHASRKHNVQIQDIFTESGTFLTRSGKTNEEKIQGTIDLHHGDRIRFGRDVSFQLCLIEAPQK